MTDTSPPRKAEQTAEAEIKAIIHDIRNPLNNISLNAELIGLALSKQKTHSTHQNSAKQDHTETLEQASSVIIQECQKCSQQLMRLTDALKKLDL